MEPKPDAILRFPAVVAIVACLGLAGGLLLYWTDGRLADSFERLVPARLSGGPPNAPGEIEAALGIGGAGARARALTDALERLGPADVDALFRVLERTNLPVDEVSLVIITDWVAGFDPKRAFERATDLGHRSSFAAACAAVRRWSRENPEEALRAIEGVHDPSGTDPLFEALVLGWAERSDDPGPWPFVEAMSMGPPRQKLIQALVGQKMALEGIEPTLRFVESIPDDAPRRLKLQAFRRAARALARQDPERAVAWARRHSDGPNGDGLLRKVGTMRVQLEGAPGIEWLLEVPAGSQRDEAVVETFRRWLMTDRPAALTWLRGESAHPALEPAVVLLVGITAREDPAAALALLERIRSPELLQTAKLRLGRSWLSHSEETATDWIRQSDLPEDLQARLLAGTHPGTPENANRRHLE